MSESKLTRQEIEILATYNSEVMRGIVHTEVWQRHMARLQRIFDEMQQEKIREQVHP